MPMMRTFVSGVVEGRDTPVVTGKIEITVSDGAGGFAELEIGNSRSQANVRYPMILHRLSINHTGRPRVDHRATGQLSVAAYRRMKDLGNPETP